MYQSPFRIIDADALPQEPEALRRALLLEKKKLLAEFELAGSASIVVNGRELHRQEVISLFDELGNEACLRYHHAIRQDTALLHFLEEGKPEPGRLSNGVYDETGFLYFVSPHFAAACNALMQRVLAGAASVEEIQVLHQAKVLLLPADTETAYRYVTRFFTEKKNALLAIRHRTNSGEAVSAAGITAWCTDDQVHLLNRLPDTFADLRYTLANILNNLCVAYDRMKANRQALAAIERAATIRVDDEELKRLIPDNLRIIRNKQSNSWYNVDPKTGKKTPKIGLIIALIIIIIRIATAGDGCNNSSPDVRSHPAISYKELSAPERSFGALLKALVRPKLMTSPDSEYDNTYQYTLIRPKAAGDDPFSDLFKNGFNDTGFTTGARAGDCSVYVNNQSSWQAIIIYQSGGRRYSSAYVPPHESYVIRYTGDVALQLYAGNSWSDSVLHVYDHYAAPSLPFPRILWGGFREQATIPFNDTTGVPMYSRTTASGRVVHDTLSLFNAAANVIQVTYDLGE